MDNTPIYYKKMRNFEIWKDADGNRIAIRDMKVDYLNYTINFLYKAIREDSYVNMETCQGFIDEMKKELDTRY